MMNAVDLAKTGKLVAVWSRDGHVMIKLHDGTIREVTSNTVLDEFAN